MGHEIVDRVALDEVLTAVEAQVEPLVERMVARYVELIPAYRSVTEDTLNEVRDLNRVNVTLFVAAMRTGQGPSPEETAVILDSASKRAREGLPLSAVLSAYRLGAQILWDEVRTAAGGQDRARLIAATEIASRLMQWVDAASGVIAELYLEEFERQSSDREATRRDFIDGVARGGFTPVESRARAEALGLDPDGPMTFAILAVQEPLEEQELGEAYSRVRALVLRVIGSETPVVDARRGAGFVALLGLDGPAGAAFADRLRLALVREEAESGIAWRAGVGRPREGLTDLAGSHREASIALSAARAGSNPPVVLYGEVMVEELLLRERSLARRLARTNLQPLDGSPELRQTLIEYINHGPSLPAVARRLFLHPNTVSYRLSRIRELTGRDPRTPAGIAELFLALRAAQLVEGGSP